MATIDVVQRGRDSDALTNIASQTLTTIPAIILLSAVHFETLGLRILRSDPTGRLLVNAASQTFQVINLALTDTEQSVIAGAPVFRRVTFYAFNANALVRFQLQDQTLTARLTIVPNVALTIEGFFLTALALNANAGVVANLQVIVGQDVLQGA